MKRLVIMTALFLAIIGFARIASANSSYFSNPKYCTNSATSSKTQVFPGQATTTCVFDAFESTIAQPSNSATLLVQQMASGTTAVLNVWFEYSQDGIDWYGDTLSQATTTTGIGLNPTYAWNAATTAVSKKAFGVRTPTRYVRANFTAITATTSVWAQFVPLREVRE